MGLKGTLGPRQEKGRPARDDTEVRPSNPSSCGVTFHISRPGNFCTPRMTLASIPASREDLDHLKTSLEDTSKLLRSLQDAAALEDGKSRYQDIISEALPDVREANMAFHESLAKFLQELEDHIQADDHPHVEDEKKKLKEHLRMMDHMLQVTSRLADQLDQASQSLLVTLTEPMEKPTALLDTGTL